MLAMLTMAITMASIILSGALYDARLRLHNAEQFYLEACVRGNELRACQASWKAIIEGKGK